MSSTVLTSCAHFSSSPMDSSTYRQNFKQTPQIASPYSVALVAVLAAVATTIAIETYRPKDVHFTHGQVAATMDSVGKSASIKPLWPTSSSAWVTRLLDLCNCGNEEAALKEISLASTDFKSSGEFQLLSSDLIRLTSVALPDIVLIGLLRNTYSVRAHIPIWSALLDQTEKTLTKHQKNPRVLLRGLKGH